MIFILWLLLLKDICISYLAIDRVMVESMGMAWEKALLWKSLF